MPDSCAQKGQNQNTTKKSCERITILRTRTMESTPLKELLKKHRTQIDELLQTVAKGVTESAGLVVDEVFVLRFILSDEKKAAEKLSECLKWREERAELLEAAKRNGGGKNKALVETYLQRGPGGWLGDQYLVFVIRGGRAKFSGLMKEISKESLVEDVLLMYEVMYARLDKHTRETGRLCKLINLMDAAGLSMSNVDRKFFQALSAASHQSTVVYPQLLAKMVAINTGAVLRTLFSMIRPLMPKSHLEKQSMCMGKTGSESIEKCPFMEKFGEQGRDAIPTFVGGSHPFQSYWHVEGINDGE